MAAAGKPSYSLKNLHNRGLSAAEIIFFEQVLYFTNGGRISYSSSRWPRAAAYVSVERAQQRFDPKASTGMALSREDSSPCRHPKLGDDTDNKMHVSANDQIGEEMKL
jgi:hypothetical protein